MEIVWFTDYFSLFGYDVQVGLVPEYPVFFGRRDSLTANINLANLRLPAPFFNFTQLKENFANVGLDETDLIALSGMCILQVWIIRQLKLISIANICNTVALNATPLTRSIQCHP